MENRLHYQQEKVKKHKQYLHKIWQEYQMVFWAMLVPAVAWGWKMSPKGFFKKTVRFGFLAFGTYFERQILIPKLLPAKRRSS
jgi:hypothetical protein